MMFIWHSKTRMSKFPYQSQLRKNDLKNRGGVVVFKVVVCIVSIQLKLYILLSFRSIFSVDFYQNYAVNNYWPLAEERKIVVLIYAVH